MPQRYRKILVNGKTRQLSRFLMERHLGRTLSRNELVHHKNHDSLDDRLDNYELLTPKEHSVHHNQKHPLEKACAVCGTLFVPHPTKRARQVTCSRDCFRAHGRRNGLAQFAERPPVFAKLTIEQSHEIRRLYAAGNVSQRELGSRFGVHHSQIGHIVRGTAWRWA